MSYGIMPLYGVKACHLIKCVSVQAGPRYFRKVKFGHEKRRTSRGHLGRFQGYGTVGSFMCCGISKLRLLSCVDHHYVLY